MTAVPRGRAAAYAAGLVLAVVVAWPARQHLRPAANRVDGFPLSYYPMFSAARSGTGTVHHLVGVDADGAEHPLHFRHAGTGGLNQVRRQINRRVREGRADVLARAVAASVARGAAPSVVAVRVVTSRHRYDEFFAGNRTPRSRTVVAEAPVPTPRGDQP